MALRRCLFDPTDPASLQAEQRLEEVAVILAGRVIRMRERGRWVVTAPKVKPCRVRGHGNVSPRGRAEAGAALRSSLSYNR